MESIIKSDIFFFIATVMTVLVGLLVAVICVYVITVLRHIKFIVDKIRSVTEGVTSAMQTVQKVTQLFNNNKHKKNGKKTNS